MKLPLLIAVVFGTVAGTFGMTDAEWVKMKEDNLNKPRRLIINHDGCDGTAFPEKQEVTEANFRAYMLDKLKGTKFDVLAYCPFSVGLTMSYPSRVADRYTEVPQVKGYRSIVSELEKITGSNPMQIAREFARENGLEFFGSIRVNDTHDRFFPQLLPPLKQQHPEWLCGTRDNAPPRGSWTSFDYAHPEVRKHLAAIAAEMIRDFDLDGLEFDFYRDDCFFKSFAWGKAVSQAEADGFTEMLRTIRADAESFGRERGRPVLIALRLPDSPEICRLQGLDVECWMREGLFDLCFSGGDHGNFATCDVMGNLCRKYGIKFYPGVDLSNMGGSGVFNRNSNASFDGQAATAAAAGADGLYFFNMFYHTGYFPYAEGSGEAVAGRNKSYYATLQKRWITLFGDERRLDRLPLLGPGYERRLMAGEPFTVIIQTGENHREYPIRQATLHVAVSGESESLSVTFNGERLKSTGKAGGVVSFAVTPELIKSGANQVTFIVPGTTAGARKTILVGDTLLKMPKQLPWRRLFTGQGVDPRAEEIVDGAYRISDRSTEAAANLLYPLSGIGGAPLITEFTLRVLPGSEPLTAVLRLANGKNVEIVDFQPGKIRLVKCDRTFAVDTEKFHRYRVELANGEFALNVDGKPLWRGKAVGEAGTLENVLVGCNDTIPGRDEESLLIGSLSGEGRGASEWKDVILDDSLMLTDVVLEVKMATQRRKELEQVSASEPEWDFVLDFPTEKLPEKLSSDYKRLPAHPEGGTVFDHDANFGNIYQLMRMKEHPLLQKAGRFAAFELEAAPLNPPKKSGDDLFLIGLRLPAQGKTHGVLDFTMKLSDSRITTPWNTFPLTPEMHRVRILLDRVSGAAELYLDGKLLDSGEIRPGAGTADILWGDGSSVISGSMRVKSVKAAIFD